MVKILLLLISVLIVAVAGSRWFDSVAPAACCHADIQQNTTNCSLLTQAECNAFNVSVWHSNETCNTVNCLIDTSCCTFCECPIISNLTFVALPEVCQNTSLLDCAVKASQKNCSVQITPCQVKSVNGEACASTPCANVTTTGTTGTSGTTGVVTTGTSGTTGEPTGKCCRWCRQSLFNITTIQSCAIETQASCFIWKIGFPFCQGDEIGEASWVQGGSCPCIFEPCCNVCLNQTIPAIVEPDVCHNTSRDDCERKTSEKQCPPNFFPFAPFNNCTLCSGATTPECSDGTDNDANALIDFPEDPGCSDPFDDDESTVVTTGTSGTTGVVTTGTSGTTGTTGIVTTGTTGQVLDSCCRWCRRGLFEITNVQPCAPNLGQDACLAWRNQSGACGATPDIPEASWTLGGPCECIFEPCCITCRTGAPNFTVTEADVCHNTSHDDCQQKRADRQCSPPAVTAGFSFVCTDCVNVTTECSDGIDNDGNLLVDFPADPGCSDPFDDDESSIVTTGTSGTTGDGLPPITTGTTGDGLPPVTTGTTGDGLPVTTGGPPQTTGAVVTTGDGLPVTTGGPPQTTGAVVTTGDGLPVTTGGPPQTTGAVVTTGDGLPVTTGTTGQITGRCCRWCRQSLFNVTNIQPCVENLSQEACLDWNSINTCAPTEIAEASFSLSGPCVCEFLSCCIFCHQPPNPDVFETDVCHNTTDDDCAAKLLAKMCLPPTSPQRSSNCLICANVTATTGTTGDGLPVTTGTTGTTGVITTGAVTTGAGPPLFHCCTECVDITTGAVTNAKCLTVNDTALCCDLGLVCSPTQVRVNRNGAGPCISPTTCPARVGPCNNTCIWSTAVFFNASLNAACINFTWGCGIDRFILELPTLPCVKNLRMDVTIEPASECHISRGFDVCNRGLIGPVFSRPLRVDCCSGQQQATICIKDTIHAGPSVGTPPAIIPVGTIAKPPVCNVCEHTLVTWECAENATKPGPPNPPPGQNVNDNDSNDTGETELAVAVFVPLGVALLGACCFFLIYFLFIRPGRRNDPVIYQPVPGQNVIPVPTPAHYPAASGGYDLRQRI